jgi:hypothetical protein
VTQETRMMFLGFLALASITVCALVVPVAPLLWKHTMKALYTSLQDPWASEIWWHRWYSWVLIGGPLGRWPVGIGLGQYVLQKKNPPSNWKLGSMINGPSLATFVMAQVGILLAYFTMVCGQL